MHLFTPDPILEEDIFIPRNRDWECETIGQLLFEYGEKFIEPALSDGMYSLAVKRYLQMLDSLIVHFVVDERWTYFNDLFFPNKKLHYKETFNTFVAYEASDYIWRLLRIIYGDTVA